MDLLRGILTVLAYSGYSFGQSAPDMDRKPAPLYSSGPVTEWNLAQPNSGEVLRLKRGERYNFSESGVPELGESSEPILVQLAPTSFQPPPAALLIKAIPSSSEQSKGVKAT